jgi:hypothetical protein
VDLKLLIEDWEMIGSQSTSSIGLVSLNIGLDTELDTGHNKDNEDDLFLALRLLRGMLT